DFQYNLEGEQDKLTIDAIDILENLMLAITDTETGSRERVIITSEQDLKNSLLKDFDKQISVEITSGITIKLLTIDIPKKQQQKQIKEQVENKNLTVHDNSPQDLGMEATTTARKLEALEKRKRRIESQIASLEELSEKRNQEIKAEIDRVRRYQLNQKLDNDSEEIYELSEKLEKIECEIKKIKIT
ncbi:MAG: hypothetical protein O4808_04010, partial [Trichodesmium sp. St17_bin3_1_1]|nr:hypothetical protein [Trichodesmium sp. St17_bin3_1_1]